MCKWANDLSPCHLDISPWFLHCAHRDWKAAFEAVIPSRKRKQDEGEEHDGAGEEQDQAQAEEQQQQPAEQQQQDQQQGEQQEAEQPPAKRQAVAEQS